jgi:hypothetical protein
MHKLNCPACTRWYRGQAQPSFKVRYNEPTQAVCNNNENSRYSQHILNTLHLRNVLESTFDVLGTHKKDHIYCEESRVINLLVSYFMYRHLLTDMFPLHCSLLLNVSHVFYTTYFGQYSFHQFSALLLRYYLQYFFFAKTIIQTNYT